MITGYKLIRWPLSDWGTQIKAETNMKAYLHMDNVTKGAIITS